MNPRYYGHTEKKKIYNIDLITRTLNLDKKRGRTQIMEVLVAVLRVVISQLQLRVMVLQ